MSGPASAPASAPAGDPRGDPRGEPDATDAARPPLTTKTLVYRLCSLSSWLYLKLWHRLEVRGLEHIPRTGGVVLASNHQSHLDILIYGGCVPRHVCFVARDTLARQRWLAYTMRECGAVLIQRGASDRKALRAMADHLELGDLVAIFPEGTRTEDGHLRAWKGGALLAARLAGVPLLPAGISGAFEAFPRGAALPRPRRIRVAFGAPIDSALPDAQERLIRAVAQLAGVRPDAALAAAPQRDTPGSAR
jgi:1-acyl-sn-glycerol-3-phosphate acyltransferase